MSKRVLALVLAIALVFSTFTVAFADETISDDVKALAAIKMLIGDGNGVTVEYAKESPTRLQSAILFLRLRGLENDAKAFEEADNFKDAQNYKWAEGKNIMAYLKAHPELGWIGSEGNFMPGKEINEQSYYKVLLEALGYNQNTSDTVGDFEFSEVFEFAKSIGLNPKEDNDSFTIDDLARATVEVLKHNTKDGKLLIEVLIEAGKIDMQVAIDNGLYEEAIAANVKSVKAIGNSVVEVVFEEEVNARFAENAANYKIEGLEVKEAKLVAKDTVRLETAAMTAGKLYTLVVGEAKANFAGIAKVTGAPSLTKAEGVDTEKVVLTFDKALDFETATNAENYEIKDVEVVKAELDVDEVTLITEGLTANKTHTVKVKGIESIDGAVLKSASKSFFARVDKVAPRLEGVTAKTFTRLEATFTKLLTKESAVDLENYTIKAGKDDELEILSIKDITKDDDKKTTVEITTEAQKTSIRYELIVQNVVDRAVIANVMVKEGKATFSGKAADKSAPIFSDFNYISKNLVKVDFTEQGFTRLDEETALDVNNYEFNNDVDIEKVEKLPGDKEDFRSVLLTVSDLEGKTYKLTVYNVMDEYENEMKTTEKVKTFSPRNITASQVKKVWASDKDVVKVEFTKDLNKEVAEDITIYSIDGSIGTPVKAEYKAKDNVLTLTLGSELKAGNSYKLTIAGLVDLAGFAVNAKPTFVGVSTVNDIEAPIVESIEALNNKVVRVVFSEPMQVSNLAGLGLTVEEGKTMSAKVAYDDNTTFEFSFDGSEKLQDKEYKEGLVFVGDFKDVAGNKLDVANEDSVMEFYGDSFDPDKITLDGVDQTSVKSFKLIFSDRVDKATVSATGLTAAYAKVDSKEVKDEIILSSNVKFKVGKVFEVDLENVRSIHGVKVEYGDERKLELIADLEDEEAPYIEKVEATYRDEVKVTYDEDLSNAGKYAISFYDNNGREQTVGISDTTFADNVVTLRLSRTLEAGVIYTIKVTRAALDLAGNASEEDIEYDFEGTNAVRVGNYITVNVVNGTKIEVNAFNSLAAGEYAVEILDGGDEKVFEGTVVNPSKKVVIDLAGEGFEDANVLLKGKTYKLTFGDYTCTFNGVVEDRISAFPVDGKIQVSYDDIKVGDIIYLGDEEPVEVKANDGIIEAGYAEFNAAPAEKAKVYVVRGDVVLYFAIYEPAAE